MTNYEQEHETHVAIFSPSSVDNNYNYAVRDTERRIEEARNQIAFHEAEIAKIRESIDLLQSEMKHFEKFKDLALDINDLDLPIRIHNAFKRIDIDTIGELLQYISPGIEQLFIIKNFGEKSADITIKILQHHGYLPPNWGSK